MFTATVRILEPTWNVGHDQPLFFFTPSATVKRKQHKRKTPYTITRLAKLKVIHYKTIVYACVIKILTLH